MHSPKYATSLACAFWFFVAPAWASSQGDSAATAEQTQPATTAASPPPWWNRPEVMTALQLTEQQRQRMDEELLAFRTKLANLSESVDEDWKELTEAVAARQWSDARRLNRHIASVRQQPIDDYLELCVNVYSTLEAKQWDVMLEKFPGVLQSPWGLEGQWHRPGLQEVALLFRQRRPLREAAAPGQRRQGPQDRPGAAEPAPGEGR